MRVFVTRPEPGAGKTAEILHRRGHDPVMLPLSRTVTLADNGFDLNMAPASTLAATSAAALRHWEACGIDPARLALPFFAVGEATGEAAREVGFQKVHIGKGTGAELAASITEAAATARLEPTKRQPLLYAAGRVRQGGFEAAIMAVDLPLKVVEIYDIEKLSYSTDLILRQFLPSEIVAVLFYSRNAAALFFEALDNDETRKQLENGVFLCMSEQVAAAVPDRHGSGIRIAATPREDDLLSLLDVASQSR